MSSKLDSFLDSATEDEKRKVNIIREEQARIGMVTRNDSQLTIEFACGRLKEEDGYGADGICVVEELFIVDQIFKTTLYGEIIQDVMRAIAYWIKANFCISWPDTWKLVRFYIPEMLKMYCLDTFHPI